MYDGLILGHGFFGFVGLLAAVFAIFSRIIPAPHSVHVLSGQIFTIGMIGVGLTGLVIAVTKSSVFFLSLAFFVLYLAFVGWRYAKVRGGLNSTFDKGLSAINLSAFMAMIVVGGYMLSVGDGTGLLMAVFGTIGLLHAIIDIRGSFGAAITGRSRIAAHLSRMLGGTIAALTAFLLIQFESSSPIVWLAPAALLTPVMLFWKALVKRNKGLHSRSLPAGLRKSE